MQSIDAQTRRKPREIVAEKRRDVMLESERLNAMKQKLWQNYSGSGAARRAVGIATSCKRGEADLIAETRGQNR